jgi:hypothetical protein
MAPQPPAESPMPPDHDHWLVRRSTIRLLAVLGVLVLAATLVPDVFMDHHSEFGLDGTIGFGAWFGFVSCVVMVLFAKGLAALVKRRDDHYDD